MEVSPLASVPPLARREPSARLLWLALTLSIAALTFSAGVLSLWVLHPPSSGSSAAFHPTAFYQLSGTSTVLPNGCQSPCSEVGMNATVTIPGPPSTYRTVNVTLLVNESCPVYMPPNGCDVSLSSPGGQWGVGCATHSAIECSTFGLLPTGAALLRASTISYSTPPISLEMTVTLVDEGPG